MPRTIPSDCPGCPPIRALTTDELGLIKVVESHGKASIPKVVETWGKPDATGHVLLASMADHMRDPVLAIARKNNQVELINPLNGDILVVDKVGDAIPDSENADDGKLSALHLFKTRSFTPRSYTVLLCTDKGKACLRSVTVSRAPGNSSEFHSLKLWDVCKAGKVLCSSVDGLEKYAVFAGKGVEVNIWDLDISERIWAAKSPQSNNLGIFTPTWFTATTFLCKEDHRKIAAGTNNHEVRLYDISAQRRPVISLEFRDSSIRAIAEDSNGYGIYIGTGKGDLASFDMRTGKLLGTFIGKCSGSIRSITRHPELPVLVSCGLDRYMRCWNTENRELLSAVFLKQILTNVVLDTKFADEGNHEEQPSEPTLTDQSVVDNPEVQEVEKPSKKAKKVKSRKSLIKVGNYIQTWVSADAEENEQNAMQGVGPSHEDESRKPQQKRRKKSVRVTDD